MRLSVRKQTRFVPLKRTLEDLGAQILENGVIVCLPARSASNDKNLADYSALGGILRDAAAKAVHTYTMCTYLRVSHAWAKARKVADFDLDQCTTKEWSKLNFYICTR